MTGIICYPKGICVKGCPEHIGPPSRMMGIENREQDPAAGYGDPNADIQVKKKTKIRGGHRAHLRKLLGNIARCLTDYDPYNEIELLASRNSLDSKGELLRKLDEGILENIEDGDLIQDEIEGNEKIQLQVKMKIIEVDKFLKSRKCKNEK